MLIDRRRGLLQGRSEEEDEGQEVQASDAAAKSRSREEGERGQKLLKGGAEERTSEGLCDEEDSALPVEQKPRVLDLVYLWGFFLWFICLCKKRKEDQEKKTLFYERVSKKKSVVSTRRGRNALWRAVGRSGVLGVLGFFRFLLLLLCDYHVRTHSKQEGTQMARDTRRQRDTRTTPYISFSLRPLRYLSVFHPHRALCFQNCSRKPTLRP